MKHTYTLEQLTQAVKSSYSLSRVLNTLGLNASGNAYTILKKRIAENQLDISHFTGQSWAKGTKGKTKAPNKIPLSEILEGRHPYYQSHKLRIRLLEAGYFDCKCQRCGLSRWMGLPIPLQLEHIDGDSSNHLLTNLTIICANCHAQTETFAGKNKKSGRGGGSRTHTVLPGGF